MCFSSEESTALAFPLPTDLAYGLRTENFEEDTNNTFILLYLHHVAE